MYNNQTNDNTKLDWMYKGPHSNVSREEYLLGRSVDKAFEEINEEEKQKELGVSTSKNRVEHECIPPSIRDFNKIVTSQQQVDLSSKLQEDPLVAIKKREEDFRRQFLQNPVQMKKLHKALRAQQRKEEKRKRKSEKSYDGKELDEKHLDIILMHKYNAFKSYLTEEDMREILDLKTVLIKTEDCELRDKSSWGLVRSDGTKIPLKRETRHQEARKDKHKKFEVQERHEKKQKTLLSADEMERLRREMMKDAKERDKERSEQLNKYRESERREEEHRKNEKFDRQFLHKQLRKSVHISSLEKRIKSNVNKIQRSENEMQTHFSRRH